MRIVSIVFCLTVLFGFDNSSYATDWITIPILEVVDRSEIVVYAESETGDRTDYLNIIEVLKGKLDNKKIEIGKISNENASMFRQWGKFNDKEKAVFALSKQGYINYKWTADKKEEVIISLLMEENPSEFIKLHEFSTNGNLAYLLGKLFKDSKNSTDKISGIRRSEAIKYWIDIIKAEEIKIRSDATYEKDRKKQESLELARGESYKALIKLRPQEARADVTSVYMMTYENPRYDLQELMRIFYDEKALAKIQEQAPEFKGRALKERFKKRVYAEYSKPKADKLYAKVIELENKYGTDFYLLEFDDNLFKSILGHIDRKEQEKAMGFYRWAFENGFDGASRQVAQYGNKKDFEAVFKEFQKNTCLHDDIKLFIERSNFEDEKILSQQGECNHPPINLDTWQSWYRNNIEAFELIHAYSGYCSHINRIMRKAYTPPTVSAQSKEPTPPTPPPPCQFDKYHY